MGTLCKNCPFKGVKRTEGSCTELFAKKYHNSCVTYDISKHQFLKELNEFEKQMKTEVIEMTEEKFIITPKSYRTDTTIVSARIPTDLVEKIEKLGKESNRNRNEMIQMLLTYAVDRAEVRHEETTK